MCVLRHIIVGRLLAGAAVLFAALPVTAQAAGGPPKPSPAVAQYVEMIPTGAGEKPVSAGAAKPAALPPATRALVRSKGGSDSGALTKIATSSALGAPASPPRRGADTPTAKADQSGSSAAAVAALSTGSVGGGVNRTALLAVLLVVTGGVVVAALLRRRAG